MIFDRQDINSNGKLKHLVAPDMFWNGYNQVFAAKTGKYLGIVTEGQKANFNEPEEIEIVIPEIKNPNQLSLF